MTDVASAVAAAPTPDVTVVTATYNLVAAGRQDTFREAAASVRSQSGVAVEHIVVDGASRDGTEALLGEAAAANPELRLIVEPDAGIYDAMNKGARAARGEFVLFLNSDDFYHVPDGLALLADAIRKAGADYGYGPLTYLKPSGERRVSQPDLSMALGSHPFGHQTLAVRRSVMADLGHFDTSYRIAADYDFILRLVLSGARGAALERSIVTMRAGGASSDRPAWRKETGRIWRRNFEPYVCMTEEEAHAAGEAKTPPLRVGLALLRAALRSGTPTPRMALRLIWRTIRRSLLTVRLRGDRRTVVVLGLRIL